MLADFNNSFTVGLSSEFAARLIFPTTRYMCLYTTLWNKKRWTIANTLDVFYTMLLNISICVLLNHTKCSKCRPLAWIHAQRRLCHSSIASSTTLCPKPCQTFVRRCFSSSMSRTWWVSHMFPCIHLCQRRTFWHLLRLKSTRTAKFIWLILSTIRQNGDILLDMSEFCYFWCYGFYKVV